jgi:hypothetical protein
MIETRNEKETKAIVEASEQSLALPDEEQVPDYTVPVALFFGGVVPLAALTQMLGLGMPGFVASAVGAGILAACGGFLKERIFEFLPGLRTYGQGMTWGRFFEALAEEGMIVDADPAETDPVDEQSGQPKDASDADEQYAPAQLSAQEGQGEQAPAPANRIPAQFTLGPRRVKFIKELNKARMVYLGDAATRQIAIPIDKMYHVIDVASSGKGKSNRFRLAMMQIASQCETYFINPFANNVKAVSDSRKIEVWKPIFDLLANGRPVKDGPEILSLMTALVREIETRNAQESAGDFSWMDEPVFLFIDELPEVFTRCPEAVELLDRIGRTGRQFLVFAWVAAQTAAVKEIGQSTAAQANYKTRIYGGGDRNSSGRMMKGAIPMEYEQALQSNGAGLTLMLADGFSDLEFVRAPLVNNEALFDYLGLPPFRIEEWLVPAAPTASRQPVQRLVADPTKTTFTPLPLLPDEAAQAQKAPQTVEEKGKREKGKRVKGPNDDAILDALDALEEEEKALTLHAIAKKAGLTRHQYDDIEEVAIEYGYELDRGKGRPAKEG